MVTTQVSNKERKQREELNEGLISNDNQRVDNSMYRDPYWLIRKDPTLCML